ncbi:hypothetical protein [Kribbella solani]|uniref:Uncharacterized protein n=1 Tax=Kribbella solani TaxID=236067 RepID=A0A841DL66_9ACTN|nr:hypothetical protein [Kribbella solani]MBB5979854.1 hypothetical protein [Kribbella solani]
MKTELDFLVLILAGTFLTFIFLVAMVGLLIPPFIHRFDRTGDVPIPILAVVTFYYVLGCSVTLGYIALAAPWLAEGVLGVILFYAVGALVRVYRSSRGADAVPLGWLSEHGVTQRRIRDLRQARTTADLRAWACLVTLAAPVIFLLPATWHQVDSAVYEAGFWASVVAAVPLLGCIFLNGRLRVCDSLLLCLGEVCAPDQPRPWGVLPLERWLGVRSSATYIWHEGRTPEQRAFEGARLCIYRLVKQRSRQIPGVDPLVFRQSAQFLVEDLHSLADNAADARTSVTITRIIRFAILGDVTLLGRSALQPASLINDRAYSRWPLRQVLAPASLIVGLIASLVAIAEKL